MKLHDVRVYRGAECGTDHYLVKTQVFFPVTIQSDKRAVTYSRDTHEVRYNLDSLKEESTVFLFKSRLTSKLQSITYSSGLNTYENIIKSINEAAMEALGEKEETKRRNDEWWNENIEELVLEKKRAYHIWLTTQDTRDRKYYAQCSYIVKKAVKKAKNDAWDRRCKQIDQSLGYSRSSEAWRTLKLLRTNRKEKIPINLIPLTEWVSYYKHLFTEDRPEFLKINDDVSDNSKESFTEEDVITEAEVRKALSSMKNGRAPGPKGIPIELLKHGPTLLFQLLTFVFNCFLRGEQLPPEWKTAYISNLHKKGDRKICSNYRGLSVTNSISRLYGKIIKERIEQQIQEVDEQNGFRTGRSCSDNLFCLKQLLEKRMSRNLETHLIFIDLKKAYDSIPLSRLWPAMSENGVSDLNVQAVRNLYSNICSKIKIGSKLSEEFPISKGLRQGCAIAPTLFKIYLNSTLKHWRRSCRNMGISVDKDKLFTLHFADDQVIFAEDEDDVSYMIRKLIEEYRKWGLSINMDKTEYLVAGGPKTDLVIEQGTIKGVDSYKYLGVNINKSGTSEAEIKSRINKGKIAIKQLNSVLWTNQISSDIKIKIFITIVESITTYGAEVWEMTEHLQRKLVSMEMSYLRRCCRVTLNDKISNSEIKQRMKRDTTIIDTIQSRCLSWYGHVCRMPEDRWPKKIMTWVPSERRRRGRPRKTWFDGIKNVMSQRNLQEGDWWDRQRWRLGCEKRL